MKNIKSFILGAITTAMLGALTVSALAAANVIEINTNVKIMVNGTAFAPKDKNGKDALVFIYDGTTYAPLRAIADAYGLNIGYDDNSRMVTVGKQGAIQKPETKPEITPEKWSDEDEKAYQEFKAMWTVDNTADYYGHKNSADSLYMKCDDSKKETLYTFCASRDVETVKKISCRASREFLLNAGYNDTHHNDISHVFYRCNQRNQQQIWYDDILLKNKELYEVPGTPAMTEFSYYKPECLKALK